MANNTNRFPMLSQENQRREGKIISRGNSICKKMNDLVTLCDVKDAVIIQDVQNKEEYAWPSPEEARKTFVEFMEKPYGTISPKLTTQASFLETKKKHLIEEITRIEAKNMEIEAKLYFHCLEQGRPFPEQLDLNKIENLIKYTEMKKKEISEGMPYVPTMSKEPEKNEALTAEALATFKKMNMVDKVDLDEWFEGHSGTFTGGNGENKEEASELDLELRL